MAEKLKLKFDQYWSECHVLLAIAAIVDPCFNMKLVECYYQAIYDDDDGKKAHALLENFEIIYQEYMSHSPSKTPQYMPLEITSTINVDGPEKKKVQYILFMKLNIKCKH